MAALVDARGTTCREYALTVCKIGFHAAVACVAGQTLLESGSLGPTGLLRLPGCGDGGAPIVVSSLLAFELAFTALDTVMLCAHPRARLDMLFHHAATIALIVGGGAQEHWRMGLHVLAVITPGTVLLLMRKLLRGSSVGRGLRGAVDLAFAASFLWARVILLPVAFASALVSCEAVPARVVVPQAGLLAVGFHWSWQVVVQAIGKRR